MAELDGRSLTLAQVVAVARRHETVSLAPSAIPGIDAARDFVDRTLAAGDVVYGLSTGFGKFSDRTIPAADTAILQRNLILSHACALGEPLPAEVVRAVMLLRANALCHGHSGIRRATLQLLLDALNAGVHPVIPSQGSLGASGDLAPLSHMALVLIGEGEAEYRGERFPGGEAMRRAGLKAVDLAAKEGLALINGTQVMTAIGALAAYDARRLCAVADVAAALTCEALTGITAAFDEKVHELRPHPGQRASAANLRRLLAGSRLALPSQPGRVQDAYSLRCAPQVHGACRDAVEYAAATVERELDAVTDNPLVFPATGEAISGGNFHGEPVALALDFLGIALAELADISERRTERLVNPALSNGLPAFLSSNGGVNSGFMVTQYAAASLVSENKVWSHPASVDSIPSSANQEDHVSMGTTAARKARTILGNAEKVLAIELLCAVQAAGMRGAEGLSPAGRAVFGRLREDIPPVREDVAMYPLMEAAEGLVRSGAVLAAAESACGPLL